MALLGGGENKWGLQRKQLNEMVSSAGHFMSFSPLAIFQDASHHVIPVSWWSACILGAKQPQAAPWARIHSSSLKLSSPVFLSQGWGLSFLSNWVFSRAPFPSPALVRFLNCPPNLHWLTSFVLLGESCPWTHPLCSNSLAREHTKIDFA